MRCVGRQVGGDVTRSKYMSRRGEPSPAGGALPDRQARHLLPVGSHGNQIALRPRRKVEHIIVEHHRIHLARLQWQDQEGQGRADGREERSRCRALWGTAYTGRHAGTLALLPPCRTRSALNMASRSSSLSQGYCTGGCEAWGAGRQ